MRLQLPIFRRITRAIFGLILGAALANHAVADSITLSETWKDNSYSPVNGYNSTDSGIISASLTVPGLSSLTADDWSNLVISVSMSPYQGSGFTTDFMSDAPNSGGTVTATSATFYVQQANVNSVLVNVEKITFTRSGNTLTISDQTVNPTSIQPPWSLLAVDYLTTSGSIVDTQTYEVTLQDNLDSGNTLSVDISKIINITGANTISYDSSGDPFAHISISGSADYTPPTLTQVSPPGNLTTTNGVLTVQAKATDNTGVANVEFFWNGQDFGGGNVSSNGGLWSLIFSLTPGVNTFATVATDLDGNTSPTNSVQVTYVNPFTNATAVQFTEHYLDNLDNSQTNSVDYLGFSFNQDAAVLTAAVAVPGLQAMSAATWSNLDLSLNFGELAFSSNFLAASVLTTNSATFYKTDVDLNGNTINVEQLTVTRSGNTLNVFKRVGNPSYAYDVTPIIADDYRGTGSAIHDQKPFSLILSDGTTLSQYAAVTQTIYINGSDATNYDVFLDELDNIQVSGQSDFIPPSVQIVTPVAGQLWSNSVFTVTGRASDNIAVTNVLYSINGSPWTEPDTNINWTNWTAVVNLIPGTNTLAAYAVDSNGNISPTNQVKFVYVVSALLTVTQTGQGTISPNYSNALLQVGKNYSMTAKAATNGFQFIGWTGGYSTNGPTLVFTMASNLVLTANFFDTNRPTVTVTNPLAGHLVSNELFTIAGQASDNVAVTDVVYSLDNGPWTSANPLGTWSNWNAQVTLTPGTNSLSVYSVDSSGNFSFTNNLNFVYVLNAPLIVTLSGEGSISPNYSNALLQIGKNYSMTATGTNGFKFLDWSGSASTNGPTLLFTMASNLVFTASFLDTNWPTLTITNLVSGQHVSNAVFIALGTAHDNVLVTNVSYQVNGTGWTNAQSGNNWTNWSAALDLVPGTNTLQTYATDSSGNDSTTNNLSFFYVSSALLQIQMTGLGRLSPDYSNALLAVGQNYSITSAPATGFVFTNWLVSTNWIGGSFVSRTNLNFTMVSNLTLQANFVEVSKPALTITTPIANQKLPSAVAAVTGTASDNWKVVGVWYQLNGGLWNPASTTNSWTNWNQTLPLIAGTNTLKAYALDLGGNYSATNNVSFVSSNTFMLQLTLNSSSLTLPGGLSFTLQASSNLTGHIQYSTNLLNWNTLTNFVGTNSTLNFHDPAATNSPQRFYRAAIP